MHVVILTQYYPPETGAPQNRLHALSKSLKSRGHQVTVLTGMPNYPEMKIQAGYRSKILSKEEIDGVRICRSWLYVSKSKGLISRMLSYLSFAFTSFWLGLLKVRKADIVLVESPPLFLALSAMPLVWVKRAKLVSNISDLWPESAVVLGLVKNKMAIGLATKLEEVMYSRSTLISGQTQGIVKNIESRFPVKKVVWYPNGADLNDWTNLRRDESWREKLGLENFDFVAGYAGVIGHAQGLEVILNAAKELQGRLNIGFVIVGHGPEKERLTALQQSLGLDNIVFAGAVTKDEMRGLLPLFDCSIVPLRKSPLFLGAIPSKIFENLACGVPVVLGVEGEAKDLFVEQGQCALSFEPENESQLADCLLTLAQNDGIQDQLKEKGIDYVKKSFNRVVVNDEFIKQLESL